MTHTAGPVNRERSFGLAVGTVLLLIAAYSLWRERVLTAEILGGIGGTLVVLGWIRPSLLAWPSALWWKLAFVLGWINARIILTLIFVLILVPMSLVWRLIGRDPLARRPASRSGWSPYPARYRNHKHYDRMF
jgi:hypothetical protein